MFSKVKRFDVKGRKINFRIKPIPENQEPTSWISGGLKDMLQHALKDVNPHDKVGITFSGKNFSAERGNGWLSFRECSEIKFSDVWEMISKIFQSNSCGINTEDFNLTITSVKIPVGSGKTRSNTYNTFEEECVKRRGIIKINNDDNLCLPRALVVGKVYADKGTAMEKEKIRRDIDKIQSNKTSQLILDTNINLPDEGCGIPELREFQKHLFDYKITVYKYDTKGREVIFEGDVESNKKINLLYHNNHFNVISSLTAAFCCDYYCEDCHVPYNTKNQHRCQRTCPQCQSSPLCEKIAQETDCSDCNRKFRGKACFDNHKSSNSRGSSICDQIKRCLICLKSYGSHRQHICEEYFIF